MYWTYERKISTARWIQEQLPGAVYCGTGQETFKKDTVTIARFSEDMTCLIMFVFLSCLFWVRLDKITYIQSNLFRYHSVKILTTHWVLLVRGKWLRIRALWSFWAEGCSFVSFGLENPKPNPFGGVLSNVLGLGFFSYLCSRLKNSHENSVFIVFFVQKVSWMNIQSITKKRNVFKKLFFTRLK